MAVEIDKALVGELRRRAQLTCTERARRAAEPRHMRLGRGEPLGKGQELCKTYPLDTVPLQRLDTARILEGMGDKAIVPRLE
jgi:hypothetical protein